MALTEVYYRSRGEAGHHCRHIGTPTPHRPEPVIMQVAVTEIYSPSRDEAGRRSVAAAPLQLLPASTQRVVLLAPGTITVACLAPFLSYLAG